MCMCMCMCMCICVRMCMCMCMHVCVYVCVFVIDYHGNLVSHLQFQGEWEVRVQEVHTKSEVVYLTPGLLGLGVLFNCHA